MHSVEPFATLDGAAHDSAMGFIGQLQDVVNVAQPANIGGVIRNDTVYERNPDIQGPMGAFGYSFLEDKLGEDALGGLNLRRHEGRYGSAGQFVYETLNFVDGTRTVSDIRDWLTTELGPVPLVYVEEYLAALESIDVIREKTD